MKCTNWLFAAAALVLATIPAAASAQQIGALAIDRSKGYIYGFAHDFATRAEAEERARKEVVDRGGEPTIVLVWSGNGCGAYRSLPEGDGNAYGWGVAKTREQADAIAQREAAKYSGTKVASNYGWACNEKAAKPLATIYRDSNMRTVKLAGIEWSRDNLSVTRFRNGDPLRAATDFKSFVADKSPAYLCPSAEWCARNGLFYNGAAIQDPRGLAPAGWHIPSVAEWQRLIDGLGGAAAAGRRLRKPGVWADWSIPVNDPSGMDILPAGASFSEEWKKDHPERSYAALWATGTQGEYLLFMRVSAYKSGDEAVAGGTRSAYDGLSVRLIRDPYSSELTGSSQDQGPVPLTTASPRAATAKPPKAPVAVPSARQPAVEAAPAPSATDKTAERAGAEAVGREQAKAETPEAERQAVEERTKANKEMADFAARQVAANEASIRKAAADKAAYEAALAERERIIRENAAAEAERQRTIRENDERYRAAMAEWERKVAACKAGDKSACAAPAK
uniref:FISUMP domain-containing protein n=1 Tax=Altererythrobacter segetis TaxID=1104773 RepID=UPI00140C141D|nr:FISUMP domain-containing protein [Altererythrobacter segetis]